MLTFSHDRDGPYRTGWHSHFRAQLVCASKGVITVAARTGTWVVPPQQAVWVPAGVEHEVSAQGPLAMRSLYLPPDSCQLLPSECCVMGRRVHCGGCGKVVDRGMGIGDGSLVHEHGDDEQDGANQYHAHAVSFFAGTVENGTSMLVPRGTGFCDQWHKDRDLGWNARPYFGISFGVVRRYRVS